MISLCLTYIYQIIQKHLKVHDSKYPNLLIALHVTNPLYFVFVIDLFLDLGDMCNENAEFPELEPVPVVEKEPVPSFANQVSLL